MTMSGSSPRPAGSKWSVRQPGDLMRVQNAERAGTPFLVLRDDTDQQVIVRLTGDHEVLTIGRDPGCDVAIDWDRSISRVHAELRRVGATWTIVDDGLSRNGTFVDQHRVTSRVRLTDGRMIRVGSTLMEFREPRGATEDSTVVSATGDPVSITPAQRRVLVALARPYAAGRTFATPASNQDIAAELFLSIDAVKATLRALFVRFQIADLAQNQKRAKLVERALDLGVITEAELST